MVSSLAYQVCCYGHTPKPLKYWWPSQWYLGFFGGAFITLSKIDQFLTSNPFTLTEIYSSHYYTFNHWSRQVRVRAIGFFLLLLWCPMFGPNLAGAIEGATGSTHPFDSYKYFTGAGYLTGALCFDFP